MMAMNLSQTVCLALMGTTANGRLFTPEELLAMQILQYEKNEPIDRPFHAVVEHYLKCEDEYYSLFDGTHESERYCLTFSEDVIKYAAERILWFGDKYGKLTSTIMSYYNRIMCTTGYHA